ncbi:hypothetical protein VTK26DRAFT_5590 [Humicola hyalothermophila]
MADGNTEAYVLLSLVVVIISARMIYRIRTVGFRGLALDDYLMPLGGILCIVDLIAAIFVVTKADGLTNSYMTPEERASLSPDSEEWDKRVLGSKIQVFGWTFYAASLWCIKLCVAVFYSRLTAKIAHLQLRVYIAYAFVIGTFIITACLLLFGCRPMSKYWQIYPDPGICQPTNSKLYVFSVMIPDILTDLYLLSIPLPLLWSINLSVRKKLILTVLFSGVIFVIMAAIIRGVVILTAGPEGAVSGSEWAIREEFVSIVVSNLPILQSPIRSFLKKVGLGGLFSTHGTTPTPFEGRTIGGTGGGTGGAGGGAYHLRSTKKSKTPNATLNTNMKTAWDSDEQILVEGGNGNGNSASVSANGGIGNGNGMIGGVDGSPPDGRNILVNREVQIAVESDAGSTQEPPGWSAAVQSSWNAPQRSRTGS